MREPDPLAVWVSLLIERHTRTLSKPEFLKAVRALSARYVEHRESLPRRSPIDSPGKRAAFAGFFAPLHFLTIRELLIRLGPADGTLQTIVDFGCGTGVASAAWAGLLDKPPSITGIDRSGWALDEASWNWRHLGLRGRTRRGDVVRAADELATSGRRLRNTGVVLAWTVNELERHDRQRLLPALSAISASGATVLIVEPLARGVAPWWDEWSEHWRNAGGRDDEWKLDLNLPASLVDMSEAAGFRRQWLGARTLWASVGPCYDPKNGRAGHR